MRQAWKKIPEGIQKLIPVLMLVLFLPVLLCVMFVGNRMDYFDDVKADILVPNAVLTLVAFLAVLVCLWLLKLGRKYTFTKRTSCYMDLFLVVLFTGFYFFCMWLTRETVFDLASDYAVAREAAKDIAHKVPFGYQYIHSMNHNNLPITYILGILYRIAEKWTWFSHDPEYLWLVVGCLLVTGAGFCCCEIVKRLTGNPAAVLLAFLIYLATAGMSPWKGCPYTDNYGVFFPTFCVWMFLCGKDCKRKTAMIPLLFLAMTGGVIGGFIKPSAYIAVLAVLAVEMLDVFSALVSCREARGEDLRRAVLIFSVSLIFTGLSVAGARACKNYIINDIELEYNEEIEATAQYFFFIGTKELTTGSFSTEDYGIFGEFQFSKADRNAACMERAWERIRERGFFGTVYFCLKKLVKSFNDGTFAWTDVEPYTIFPEDLQHNNVFAGYARSLFMPLGPNQAKYDTLAELVWIFVLMGVPGIALAKKEKCKYLVYPVIVIGVLSYLMLFESGARYVYIFLPAFIVTSVCGMELIGKHLCSRATQSGLS